MRRQISTHESLTDTRPWPLREDWSTLVNLESLYGMWLALASVNFEITCATKIITVNLGFSGMKAHGPLNTTA
jgi:uncharacterized membrane protein YccF (DUF307 family)